MSDNPGYGFVPSPSSPKKELAEAPNENPAVVNNYFTMFIDPQAVLLVALLMVLAIALISSESNGVESLVSASGSSTSELISLVGTKVKVVPIAFRVSSVEIFYPLNYGKFGTATRSFSRGRVGQSSRSHSATIIIFLLVAIGSASGDLNGGWRQAVASCPRLSEKLK